VSNIIGEDAMRTHEEGAGVILYPSLTDAYVGMVDRYGALSIACYDYDKVIAIYVAEGMTEEEAVEFFGVNTLGAWLGERTPCFVRVGADPDAEEE
jgi:hypothetical protein